MQRRDEFAGRSPVTELWESLVLLGLTASTLGAPIGLAFAAVKVFASR